MQAALLGYVVAMYGNGKKEFGTTEGPAVGGIVGCPVVLDGLPPDVGAGVGCNPVVLPPIIPPPPPVVDASGDVVPVGRTSVPVHAAPMGQHAMFRAGSVVHTEPGVQHAPP